MKLVVISIAAFIALVGCTSHDGTSVASKHQTKDQDNPMGLNGGCYVCHMTFVDEKLTTIHLAQDIACVNCHGTSANHANDEDIGATRPDVTFERDAIDTFCLTCHKRHDITSEMKPKHAKNQSDPVCTNCHGRHRLGDF